MLRVTSRRASRRRWTGKVDEKKEELRKKLGDKLKGLLGQ